MRGSVQLIAWLLLLAAGALAVLHLLPRSQLLSKTVVVAASLIPYGLPLAIIGLLLLAVTGSRPLALVLAGAVLLAHILIARPYWPARAPTPPEEPITVMTMNMRCNSPGAEDLARLLRESAPDVAVINGLDPRSRDDIIGELAERYPTAEFVPLPTYPVCGTVLLTHLPFDGWVAGQRHPTALLRAPGFEFALVAVDFPTPTHGLGPWLDAFDGLIEDMPSHTGRSVVAIGDFNAVPEHEPMRRLRKETALRNAVLESGLGWLPTFPDDRAYPPLVALDHALVTPDLVASSAWTASVPGQAHRALLLTVGPT
ncbi:endonuclease/exonuclease/phosphatase family protein [Tessaracoccus flavus]|uniref:Uncharacterized protein n=1 Tax=Tessaracoccus flavus TaxID=1610493 RepID=A0A1Q2CI70_9ACTN|nr:endonuclease/exonuclease/phosphatase family protein [Tessaracoccus flavus]AQP45773.1 hypothetical protein RPIT_13975 [Tessaracoccus flavus]SDZ11547.1 Uncharacterized conserved protein YafD, endonuclease/exonuclease/phosphatase (EEP) superfamily [Tessaracoccus flavus]